MEQDKDSLCEEEEEEEEDLGEVLRQLTAVKVETKKPAFVIYKAFYNCNGSFILQNQHWNYFWLHGGVRYQLEVTGSGGGGFTFKDSRFKDAEFFEEPPPSYKRASLSFTEEFLKGDNFPCLVAGKGKYTCKFVELPKETYPEIVKKVEEATYQTLPRDMCECRYLYTLGEEYICIDMPVYDWRSWSMAHRLYKGKPGQMQKIQVEDYNAYRDGGSVIFTCAGGNKLTHWINKTPTWNKVPLKIEDHTQDVAFLGIPGLPSEVVPLHTPCTDLFPVV